MPTERGCPSKIIIICCFWAGSHRTGKQGGWTELERFTERHYPDARIAARCPHMGCALKYNAAGQSWDCPCHGSRFGEDEGLIGNPATDDKRM